MSDTNSQLSKLIFEDNKTCPGVSPSKIYNKNKNSSFAQLSRFDLNGISPNNKYNTCAELELEGFEDYTIELSKQEPVSVHNIVL